MTMRILNTIWIWAAVAAGSLASLVVADDSMFITEDNKALERQRDLKDTSPVSKEDAATLKRLLSKQIFSVDNSMELGSEKHRHLAQTNSGDNGNPLFRALKKSQSSSSSTKQGRRRAIGGRMGQFGERTSGGILEKAQDTTLSAVATNEEPAVPDAVPVPKTNIDTVDTTRSGPGGAAQATTVDTTRSYNDDHYYYDDHYYGSKGSKSGNGSKGSKGGASYDDDLYYQPPVPDLVPLKLEAFQDGRSIQPPVLNGPDASDLEPGTQYMYSNEPLFPVYLDAPKGKNSGGGYVVDESAPLATVSGKCTRLDPNNGNDQYTGRAYCQYDYHFLDEVGEIEAEITAEGTVSIGEFSTLSITGGSGIFRRTVGTVLLFTGDIGFDRDPIFIPGDDIDLPASYLVEMYVWLDSLVLPGEGIGLH